MCVCTRVPNCGHVRMQGEMPKNVYMIPSHQKMPTGLRQKGGQNLQPFSRLTIRFPSQGLGAQVGMESTGLTPRPPLKGLGIHPRWAFQLTVRAYI